MKNPLIIFFLLILSYTDGIAQYFQHRFNLNYTTPYYRHERFNSGIRTVVNYAGGTPAQYYFVGIGTSYRVKDTAIPAPYNIADRLRFTRMSATGTSVLSNLGHQFADTTSSTRVFHSRGNSIAEIKNSTATGGYVAVGQVSYNSATGAVPVGISDVLFTNLSASGSVVTASRIDINGGNDTAWCIRKSNIFVNNQPTWLICGASRKSGAYTDCFVARVYSNGTIVWCRRYNFDPSGGAYTSAHNVAKQLCEDSAGNIYVVGTLQDYPLTGNGIDGLAFKLNSAGAVMWAYNYQLYTDDQFQAVRMTADGNIVIAGFTNYPGSYNMLITKLTSAGGAIMFQNILRANTGNVIFPGKAYDIVEVPSATAGPQYFLAGVFIMNGINYEMMYQAAANGVGIRWNYYNRMLYNVGFGLDYAPGTCPGLGYFSSTRWSAGFSEGHIMKTDLVTRTCNFPTPKPPSTLTIQMARFFRPYIAPPAGKRYGMRWVTYNYDNRKICYTTCTSTTPAVIDNESSPVSEQAVRSVTGGTLKIAPNPVTNTLRVQFHSLPAGEYQMFLMDMEGKLILQRKKVFNSGSSLADMDMSLFSPGVYLLRVSQGKTMFQEKIVKQ